jgi:uncharacterized protein (TIGR02246 family)
MINGAHTIIYSTDAEADRMFLRDVIRLPHVDVGRGWLVFGLPPAEVAVHPVERDTRHELYFMCADIGCFVAEASSRGIACSEIQDLPWGRLTTLALPGGGSLGVYQPRHARPPAAAADAPGRAPVVAAYTALLQAWNNRDADRFAACFTIDAHVIGFDGSLMQGRADIAAQLRAVFAAHPTAAYVAKVRDLRVLAPRLTLLQAIVGMVPAGGTALNPQVNAIQTAVFAGAAAPLEISLFQNTPAAFHGRPEQVEAMTAELTEVFATGRIVGDEPASGPPV